MTIAWWHWLALGLVLIALEMRTHGGFYILVFGVTAIFVSGLSLLEFAGPAWVQLLLFTSISVVSLLVFRDPAYDVRILVQVAILRVGTIIFLADRCRCAQNGADMCSMKFCQHGQIESFKFIRIRSGSPG